MNRLKRTWWTLLGGLIGGLLGVLVTTVITMQAIRQHPNDPSAGSVAICGMFFLPIGVVAGFVVGLVASMMKQSELESDAVPIRSRRTYVTLGILCGLAGGHNYYAGYYGRAVAQLSITLFLLPFLIGPVITVIWVLIDLLRVTQDANGEKLQ